MEVILLAEGRQPRQHRRSRQGEVRLRPQFPAAAGQGDLATAGERREVRGAPRRARTQGAHEELSAARQRAGRSAGLQASHHAPRPAREGKLFGSVGTADIAEALHAQAAFEVERSEVRLPSGPIRDGRRAHVVKLHLHTDVERRSAGHDRRRRISSAQPHIQHAGTPPWPCASRSGTRSHRPIRCALPPHSVEAEQAVLGG